MGRGSKSKADNLNHFLQHSGAEFDYLFVADADEVFDIDTVKSNIPLFYSSQFEKLAYVTPMNQCYKTSNLYSNVGLRLDNNSLYISDPVKLFTHKNYPNLYGASSLISAKFIKSIGNKFPDVVGEDVYTENLSAING
jgi:cellulose synthase/poly-beta-1,6-N-acetylglucosamine synthase-like glycosyltransferase